MKLNLTVILLLISLITYSQTEFQKGYFIKTNNVKTECLIKNEDWSNNPTHFTYKLTENSDVQTGNILQVNEFVIENKIKYIKEEVDIDMSTNYLKNLSFVKEPNWEKKTVFLKVLLEGDASLYFYSAPGLHRYFYNIENGKIIQLIYKRYYVAHQKVKANNDFRQQLLNSFTDCNTLGLNDFKNVDYNTSSLSKIFLDYNNCVNGTTLSYKTNEKSIQFNLKIKGGINVTSVNNVKNDLTATRSVSFGSMMGYRASIESEFILPFNNNKWGLFLEFAKNQKFEGEGKANGIGNSTFTYDYLEATLAMRHYIFLSQNSRASIHLGYSWDLAPKIQLEYDAYSGFEGDRTTGGFIFGIGYHYKKISIEARGNLKKKVFENNTNFYTSDFNNFNLTLGYTIF